MLVMQVALRRFANGFHKSGDTLYNTVLRERLVSGSVNNCRAMVDLLVSPYSKDGVEILM